MDGTEAHSVGGWKPSHPCRACPSQACRGAMLFALALGAAAFEVEFQLGGEPIYLVENDVPQLESFFPAGMSELMGMVDRMQQQQRQQFRAPHNPCQEVRRRF